MNATLAETKGLASRPGGRPPHELRGGVRAERGPTVARHVPALGRGTRPWHSHLADQPCRHSAGISCVCVCGAKKRKKKPNEVMCRKTTVEVLIKNEIVIEYISCLML